MFAPLFSIASHAGYILAAWVTEPEKTTAIFLIAVGSFLYMFFVFRQCYIVHKDKKGLFAACFEDGDEEDEVGDEEDEVGDEDVIKPCCTYKKFWVYSVICFPVCTILSHISNLCCLWYKLCHKGNSVSAAEYFKTKRQKTTKDEEFSIRGFFLSLSWGWMIVGFLVFILYSFFALPLPTFQLAQYLETTIQIIIVLLAFMVSYKVFTADDSDIKKFMKQLRTTYGNHANISDDLEAGGAICGEVAKKLAN